MASPAKRRKINKADTASSKPVRGLDFFFNKQKDVEQSPASLRDTPDVKEDVADAGHVAVAGAEKEAETDEELARRLQEEWNKADAIGDTNGVNNAETGGEDQADHSHPPGSIAQEEAPEGIQEEIPSSNVNTTDNGPSAPTSLPQPKQFTLGLQTATAAEDTITYTIPFDQSPLTFDPAQYVPQLQAQWLSEGGSATYALLTHAFVLVGSTQSRIKIVDTLVNLLRVLVVGDPDSLLPAVWLATNSISPPYIDLELGLGGSAISRALKKVCGLDNAGLKTLYNKYGDAGDVAFEAKKRQSLTLRKPKPLSIKSVYDSLVKIANSKGQGSVEAKQRIVERLVQDARGAEESRYIVRTLVQHVSGGKCLLRSSWCSMTDSITAYSFVSVQSKQRCSLPSHGLSSSQVRPLHRSQHATRNN
jgi:DNA ligase-1